MYSATIFFFTVVAFGGIEILDEVMLSIALLWSVLCVCVCVFFFQCKQEVVIQNLAAYDYLHGVVIQQSNAVVWIVSDIIFASNLAN